MPRKTQIQVRRDTAAEWTRVNPILASGELGFETDTGKFKIGNGTAAWAALVYAPAGNAATAGTATAATNLAGGAVGRVPVQSAANTTVFSGSPAANGQVLVSTGTTPYAAWNYPVPYLMQSGVTTGGVVDVTFNPSFASGVTPIVVASVLSTNDKPEIFVLTAVNNTGFTGKVWSSSGTASPYNNFVAASNRTIHWVATQLVP